MVRRSFGWAQDASNLDSLRRVIQILIPGTETNRRAEELVGRYVIDGELRVKMRLALASGGRQPYMLLKGSTGVQMSVEENMRVFGLCEEEAEAKTQKGGRANESCTGLAQLALSAQKKQYDKPYQSDWSTESYLKLAIALGLLDWEGETDTCAVTELGSVVANSAGQELKQAYTFVMMTYPPAVRVLQILAQDMKPHTKFDIGGQLGFIGEAGFDSLGIGPFLWYLQYADAGERGRIKSNKEKMCDKYARMTCSMLAALGLVQSVQSNVTAEFAGEVLHLEKMRAYKITPLGYDALRNSYGNSSHAQIPRKVLYETLATAAPDVAFLRYRRAHIIEAVARKPRSFEEIQEILRTAGIEASEAVIRNDISGLVNIGLRIEEKHGRYLMKDIVEGLKIPSEPVDKTEITAIKERVAERVTHIDPKYYELIDLAFLGGKAGHSADFEELTAQLLTDELCYSGRHLGGSNKPDVAAYHGEDGLLIDTKAYENGFSISGAQRDEMSRYINDNQKRDAAINPNRWWEIYPDCVKHFNHLFVSSFFVGKYKQQLQVIAHDKGEDGACITAENLLYLADMLKSQKIKYEDVKHLMKNDEIIISQSGLGGEEK